MRPLSALRIAVVASAFAVGACTDTDDGERAAEKFDPERVAENTAVPSPEYPLAGLWKRGECVDDSGLAIAPAGDGYYSISFCGRGGCFKPGTYLPNSKVVGDERYRVIDSNTIEVKGRSGSLRYVRCPGR